MKAADKNQQELFRKAVVVGAGIGGLALAIRLQSAGVQTTILEARDKPGGRAYFWEKDGFIFDAGPTIINEPDALRELWELTGNDMSKDVDLLPVNPYFRLNWPDRTNFDYAGDQDVLKAEISKISPEDVEGYERFLLYSNRLSDRSLPLPGIKSFSNLLSSVNTAPAVIRHQGFRSLHAKISTFVKNEKLRQWLSFQLLLTGGNPMTVSAIHAQNHQRDQRGGIWYAKGGTNMLITALVKQFERLGGAIRLSDPVCKIETIGDHAKTVTTKSGWSENFEAIACNADIMHCYRDLLGHEHRSRQMTATVKGTSYAASCFMVHFGLKGSWPGIPHHMMLFADRYEGLLKDIFDFGVLSEDFIVYLHHPTVTDPGLAPEGHSCFYALVPVPHQGKLPIDWKEMGPALEKRVLDEIGKRLIPEIHERIVTKFHYTPQDFGTDLNAHLGSAFGPEPSIVRSASRSFNNRDDVIDNLFFVGAAMQPAGGIRGVIEGAKDTAALMIEDLKPST